jgi:Elongation factor G C-terminus
MHPSHLLTRTFFLGRSVSQVEVVTPEDHMGDVIGDLNSRRGMVETFEDKPANMKLVRAFVPLSEMFQASDATRGGAAAALLRTALLPQHGMCGAWDVMAWDVSGSLATAFLPQHRAFLPRHGMCRAFLPQHFCHSMGPLGPDFAS